MATVRNNAEGHAGKMEKTRAAVETAQLVVRQPPILKSLLMVLSDLEKIAEVVREDKSQDLGAAGQTAIGGASGGASQGTSLRDQAIKTLPSVEVMRRKLTSHLQQEVRKLEKEARHLARCAKKGGAYYLNELYAKIRRIQSLISELAEAAAEQVKLLYIRLFVDHQQLV